MKKGLFITLIVAVALMSTAAFSQTVGVGTTKGGFANQAGQSLSKVVSQKTGIQMRSQPFGSSIV
ncbi:MAG TPA: hypothetical protein QF359_12945 [Rhodospirillales bacterium]|nr:hypothetical protein [Rhodospirillales bacterium]